MAEGEEEKKKSEFPPGFRFHPTDEELVKYYLLPRLQGRPYVANDRIIEANVYEFHPDKLIDDIYKDRGENDWYFLSRRARKYQNGDRPSRNTDDGLGRWKASTGKKEAEGTVCNGKIKFCGSVLAYFEGPIKTEKKTKWLMQELTIPQYENKLDKSGGGSSRNSKTLDENVMCRIYVTPRHKGKNNDDEENSSSACQEACSSSQPGPLENDNGTPRPKLSEKDAGKRPVAEQPRRLATAKKRACQPTMTLRLPGPMCGGGGGMQAPVRTPGHYCATGQPMGCNGHALMPRPPIPCNGQAPTHRPPVTAYSGQAAVQRHLVGCNGQALVQRPPILRLFPPYLAAASPNSFGQTMTMRPSNLAGQPVSTPSFQRPPQQQKQPETDDMRKRRVYQQHLEELYRARGAVQAPGNAAYAAQQRRQTAFTQQQPYFGACMNHHVGSMASQFPPYNCYPYEGGQQYQCSSVVPAASDSGGATAPSAAVPEASVSEAANDGNGTGDSNNDGKKNFMELPSAVKMSPDGSASADVHGTRHNSPH